MINISRFLFTILIMFFICLAGYFIFSPLYSSQHVIIDYGIHPFDICIKQPVIWNYCKHFFILTYIYSSFFFSNILFNLFFSKKNPKKSNIKKNNKKKEKNHYALINPKPPDEKLQLLVR